MNPINRIVLVICVFLTVLCFKQDRRVNVTGTVPEYPWDVAEREEKEAQEKKRKEEEAQKELERIALENEASAKNNKKGKKWYYLWLF